MSTTQNVVGRPMSKYARKVVERRDGIRPLFEFVDGPTITQVVGLSSGPETLSTENLVDENYEPLVNATITKWCGGCFFLRTEEGMSLYMGLNILQRTTLNHQVSIGSVLRCRIDNHPNGKGPRVTQIIAIIPTS